MTKSVTDKIAALIPGGSAPGGQLGLSGRTIGLAGATIGSAAIVAALLFASRRRKSADEQPKAPPIPGGEPPETD